jgi:hypothetical protein
LGGHATGFYFLFFPLVYSLKVLDSSSFLIVQAKLEKFGLACNKAIDFVIGEPMD